MTRRMLLLLSVFLLAPLMWVGAGTIATYSNGFDLPDGPSGCYVIHPSVVIDSGALALAPAGAGEPTAFFGEGGQAAQCQTIASIEFDIAFPGNPPDSPNDHGGVMFCCQNLKDRGGNAGYVIDYIAGNFRLLQMPDGAQIAGVGGVTSYEGRWRIELNDTNVTFFFNKATNPDSVFTLADTRWRGGYIGFWAYTNTGQKMTVNNLVIEYTPVPIVTCPTMTPARIETTTDAPNLVVAATIPFGANAYEPYQITVTSQDPSVAAPVGHTGGSLVLTYQAGGLLTKTFDLDFVGEGETQLTVAAPGLDCSRVAAPVVVGSPAKMATFCEDFAQPDGPPESWPVAWGRVLVENEMLTLAYFPTAAAGENDTYGGKFAKVTRIECDLTFPGKGMEWPYEHGGIIFCAQRDDAGRYQNPGSCYVVDFLPTAPGDNTGGRFRCSKFINGLEIPLWNPTPTVGLQYEGHWVVDITDTDITFTFNSVPQFTVPDSQFRGGYVGFWAYQWPPENKMAVNNVCITGIPSLCPSILPPSAINRPPNAKTVFTVWAPIDSNVAADYTVTVTSTNPAIAVPEGSTGGALDLTFPMGGARLQSFKVDCLGPGGTTDFVLTAGGGGGCLGSRATFTAREPGIPRLCDTFTQADGAPADWTIVSGNWLVAGEKLTIGCEGGGETWIWAGNPAKRIEGPTTYQFTMNLSQGTPNPNDGVGVHGGFMVFANNATNRAKSSGYEVDYIDRDCCYRIQRYDNGAATGYSASGWCQCPLGKKWRFVVDGDHLKLYVDDFPSYENLVVQAVDATYREGYFGFWTWCNATRAEIEDVAFGTVTASFTANPESGGAPLIVSFDARGSTSEGTIVSYEWDFGDGTAESGATPNHTFANEGTYPVTLTVTDDCGLRGQAQKTISVCPELTVTASFTATPENGRTPLDVSFDASASQGTIASYEWDFGDQTAPGWGATVTHTFQNQTSVAVQYAVTLTVTDTCGLTAQATKTITVLAQGTRFIRGNVNQQGDIDIADTVCILTYLFGLPGQPCKDTLIPQCIEAANANDQGSVDIADAVWVLNYLFAQKAPPPAPFPDCDFDPDPANSLGCVTFTLCQ
jgi:PKD repeat protein